MGYRLFLGVKVPLLAQFLPYWGLQTVLGGVQRHQPVVLLTYYGLQTVLGGYRNSFCTVIALLWVTNCFWGVQRHLPVGLLTYCGLQTVPRGDIDSYLHNYCPFVGYRLFLGGSKTATGRVIALLRVTDCSWGVQRHLHVVLLTYCGLQTVCGGF